MVYYGAWQQPADTIRTESSWAGPVTLERAEVITVSSAVADAGAFYSAMAGAWSSHGLIDATPLVGARVSAHVSGSGSGYDIGTSRERWEYQAGAYSGSDSVVSWSGSLVAPSTGFSEGMFPLPGDAIGVELASTQGEILSFTVEYTLTEQSYDGSVSHQDAVGQWFNNATLGASNQGVTIQGPGPENSVLSTGSVSVPYTAEVQAAGTILLNSFAVADPTFPTFSGMVLVGGLWDFSTRLELTPPLIRYVYANPPSRPQPPLRQFPRDDGLATSSANRIWPSSSQQSSVRRLGYY